MSELTALPVVAESVIHNTYPQAPPLAEGISPDDAPGFRDRFANPTLVAP